VCEVGHGHNSKALHRANAKRAQVTLPPLDDYEERDVRACDSTAALNHWLICTHSLQLTL